MRALLLPFVLLLIAGAAAFGQEQERKLADRIMKPDYTQSYDVRKSSFGADRTFGSKKAHVKKFEYDQKFMAKEFPSRPFWGNRPSWLGGKKFATASANTKGQYEIPNAGKPYETKAEPVKKAMEAGKTMETRADPYAGKTYTTRGRSQDRFDIEKGPPKGLGQLGYTGDLKTMSIDDVRALLNKNK